MLVEWGVLNNPHRLVTAGQPGSPWRAVEFVVTRSVGREELDRGRPDENMLVDDVGTCLIGVLRYHPDRQRVVGDLLGYGRIRVDGLVMVLASRALRRMEVQQDRLVFLSRP